MLTVVALVVVHDSVADWPRLIDAGAIPRDAVGAGRTTVKTVDAVAEFALLVAVIVYVVVAVGLTGNEPVDATVPIPWLIVTVVALVVPHDSVAEPPRLIDAGDTLRVAVGAGAVTVSVAVAVAAPFELVAVSV